MIHLESDRIIWEPYQAKTFLIADKIPEDVRLFYQSLPGGSVSIVLVAC